jgi:hypothetical protein
VPCGSIIRSSTVLGCSHNVPLLTSPEIPPSNESSQSFRERHQVAYVILTEIRMILLNLSGGIISQILKTSLSLNHVFRNLSHACLLFTFLLLHDSLRLFVHMTRLCRTATSEPQLSGVGATHTYLRLQNLWPFTDHVSGRPRYWQVLNVGFQLSFLSSCTHVSILWPVVPDSGNGKMCQFICALILRSERSLEKFFTPCKSYP